MTAPRLHPPALLLAVAGVLVAAGLTVLVVSAREPAEPSRGRPLESMSGSAPASSRAPVRVAAIGDSLTLYDDEPEQGRLNNSWFAALVRSEPAYVYVHNAGVVGDSTAQMRERLVDEVLAREPELVLVLGGINDIANLVPTEQIVGNLRAIVMDVQAAGARAVIGTVPPWDELFEANAVADPEEVLELNDGIRALATELGVTLIDFHGATAGPDGHWLPGTTRDGLHPDADGVALMADAAITALHA